MEGSDNESGLPSPRGGGGKYTNFLFWIDVVIIMVENRSITVVPFSHTHRQSLGGLHHPHTYTLDFPLLLFMMDLLASNQFRSLVP